MKKCNLCGEEFKSLGVYANHVRWSHKDLEYYKNYSEKMSNSTANYYNNINGNFENFKVNCFKCGIEFYVKERSKKFPEKEKYYCSKKCANSRKHSEETIMKICEGVKNKWKEDSYAIKCINNFMKKDRFSSKGEREIRNFLKEKYGKNKVSAHRLIKLSNNKFKAVDISIPSLNSIIEYDGEWHFNDKLYEKLKDFDTFSEVKIKEELLKEYCEIKGLKLLRIREDVYKKNKEEIIKKTITFLENSSERYLELY